MQTKEIVQGRSRSQSEIDCRPCLSVGVDKSIPELVDGVTAVLCTSQLEDALDDADLCRGSIGTTESSKVVDNQAGTDQVATTVNSSGNEGDLEKR